MKSLIAAALALASGTTVVTWAAVATAQDCPTGQSAAMGFVVERGEKSKTEVSRVGDANIRPVLRFGGAPLLETTQFQGLFDLERIDRGTRAVFRPTTDLAKFFPPNVGKSITAGFEITESERQSTLTVILSVKKLDQLDIGPCRYQVLQIDRSVGRDGSVPAVRETDYYSPDLKLMIAKEFKGGGGLNKFDRIYLIKR